VKRRAAAVVIGLLFCAVETPAQPVVKYYHLDGLGSVRAVTDGSGQVIERHEYLPFGEEWNPQPAGDNRKFTGKERDAETGLDYFGARYYGAQIGRFTTADPLYTWRENVVDPQRWNRYAYGRNNGLRYTDPTGLFVFDASVTDRQKSAFRSALASAERAARNLSSNERATVAESLAAYGAEGVANGVTVSFARLQVGGETRPDAVPWVYDEATNSLTASFTAVLNQSLRGDDLTIAVAHEGRHLADAQAYAAALTAEARGGPSATNSLANRTEYDREVRAYEVSGYTARGLGARSLSFGGYEIWNNRVGLQPAQLNNFLRTSPNYGLTPQSPGRRYYQ
jgi:RHS repeat-associated protein